MVENTTDVVGRNGIDTPGRVVPLGELDEYEVADGYPEIRGWEVRDATGRSIGYVYDLLADLDALRVRYLDVELDPEFAGPGADRRVLIPLESVGLDGSAEDVQLRVDAAEVRALVPYARRGVVREREAAVPAAPVIADLPGTPAAETDADFYRERHYDDARLFARGDTTSPAREPEPQLGASIDVGDLGVRKTVETERVRQAVPVVREDVEIERRPVRPGEEFLTGGAAHGDDEIRIPIMAEEIIVEKRLVAKEVLVIRKRRVSEERTVEAEVRRERVEIDDRGRRLGGPSSAAGPTDRP